MYVRIFITIFVIIVTCACTSDNNFEINDAPVEVICKLSNNIAEVGSIESLCVFKDGFAAITNPDNVFVYDFNGKQKYTIGHSGNANFEYNRPFIIRSLEDSLYVWSANSLKFIVYSKDGTPVKEYPYRSSIRDFVPSKDKLIIYNSGVNYGYTIDIYSKGTKGVTESIIETSNEHKVLLSLMSVAPLICQENRVFFVPKDKLIVTGYDMVNHKYNVSEIQSQTFNVKELRDLDILKNRKQMIEFLMSSSASISLIPHNNDILLLTLEGYEVLDEEQHRIDYSNRYYALYEVGSGKTKALYTYESLSSVYLFSVFEDSLYFIKREYNEELNDESYYLCRLNI